MIKHFLGRLARDCRGATAIEYGLIASLIVVAMMAAIAQFANSTGGMWGNIHSKVEKAVK